MNILMITIGTAFSSHSLNNTIARHIEYANAANGKIFIFNLNPKHDIDICQKFNDCVYIQNIASSNYFLLMLRAFFLFPKYVSHLEHECHLIYTQDPFGTAVIGLIARKLLLAPLIIGNHSSFIDNKLWLKERPVFFSLLKQVAHFTIPRADSLRVNNKVERQKYLDRFKIEEKKIFVNSTHVNIEQFARKFSAKEIIATKDKYKLPKNELVLLWVGRPVAVKRLKFLLSAFKLITDKNDNVTLVLAGDFTSFKDASVMTEIISNPKIVLIGNRVGHGELPKLYASSDIFCMTSAYEGFGVVLVEAGAAGLPVVCTRTDGSREIVINNETGFITDPNSKNEFAERVLSLVNSPTLRKRMSHRATNHISEFFSSQRNIETRISYWRKIAETGTKNQCHNS